MELQTILIIAIVIAAIILGYYWFFSGEKYIIAVTNSNKLPIEEMKEKIKAVKHFRLPTLEEFKMGFIKSMGMDPEKAPKSNKEIKKFMKELEEKGTLYIISIKKEGIEKDLKPIGMMLGKPLKL